MTGTGSREEVLRRIRAALADVPAGETPGDVPVPRDYLDVHADRTPYQSADLLAAHLADYRARVHRTGEAGLPATIARLLTEHGTRSAVVPPALPEGWLSEVSGVDIHDSGRRAPSTRDLDRIDTVITGCAVAIAETGTLVLDGSPDQGHRRITLVPDHHICVVRAPGDIVGSLPQALPRLRPTRPLTWISGPSATSDIELDRVEGVHGPRTLDVVIVTEPDG